MSDAQGNQNNPANGDPIEDAATPAESATPETTDGATRRASQDAGAESAAPIEPSSSQGAADDASVDADVDPHTDAPSATEPEESPAPIVVAPTEPEAVEPMTDAPVAPEPEPVESRTDAPAAADAPAPEAPADEAPAKSEPDYAALAAELEEFENRTSSDLGARPAEEPPAVAAEPVAGSAAPGSSWFEKADNTFKATDPEGTAPTEVAPAVTPSEPVAAPAPVFVEAPEPPRRRGNRLAALLIAIPATIAFAILYLAAALGYGFLTGYTTSDNLVDSLIELVTTPAFWVPVAAFFLAFWLLGVIVNRGKAGWWVVLGIFVGLAAYAGYVFGPVLTYPFWMVTASEAREAVVSALLHPVAIAAFVIGREATVWFGAWAARRGRKMVRLNAEDRAEYDRALETGQ